MKKMKEMKKLMVVLCLLSTTLVSVPSYATVSQERMYLTQVFNELNAIQPLLLAARAAQPKNLRTQFHYTRFQDSHGCWHNGLLDDVQAIRGGIQQQLNSMPVEPRAFAPIKGDYLDSNGRLLK